jgi:mortality factor 4-like protein 1
MQILLLTVVLVSLPAMVAGSTMDPESVGLVRDYVTELMT